MPLTGTAPRPTCCSPVVRQPSAAGRTDVCRAGRATSRTRTNLVQDTLLQTFRNLPRFEYRGEGALHAYLRQVVMNRIREELRRHSRRPAQDALESGLEDDAASPLEAAIGQETVNRMNRRSLRSPRGA